MYALHESVDLVHSWQGAASLIIWFLAEITQARSNIFIRVTIWKKHKCTDQRFGNQNKLSKNDGERYVFKTAM